MSLLSAKEIEAGEREEAEAVSVRYPPPLPRLSPPPLPPPPPMSAKFRFPQPSDVVGDNPSIMKNAKSVSSMYGRASVSAFVGYDVSKNIVTPCDLKGIRCPLSIDSDSI